jgi:hypothetical protein
VSSMMSPCSACMRWKTGEHAHASIDLAGQRVTETLNEPPVRGQHSPPFFVQALAEIGHSSIHNTTIFASLHPLLVACSYHDRFADPSIGTRTDCRRFAIHIAPLHVAA